MKKIISIALLLALLSSCDNCIECKAPLKRQTFCGGGATRQAQEFERNNIGATCIDK